MKTFLVLFFTMPFLVYSQGEHTILLPIDSISGKITYKEIIQIDSISEEKLYSFCKVSVSKLYKGSKLPIKIEDFGNNKLISKISFSVPFIRAVDLEVYCTITVECKSNKVRILLSDFLLYWSDDGKFVDKLESKYPEDSLHTPMKKKWRNSYVEIDKTSKRIIELFKLYLNNSINDDKKW